MQVMCKILLKEKKLPFLPSPPPHTHTAGVSLKGNRIFVLYYAETSGKENKNTKFKSKI